jgi:hypothetical protein
VDGLWTVVVCHNHLVVRRSSKEGQYPSVAVILRDCQYTEDSPHIGRRQFCTSKPDFVLPNQREAVRIGAILYVFCGKPVGNLIGFANHSEAVGVVTETGACFSRRIEAPSQTVLYRSTVRNSSKCTRPSRSDSAARAVRKHVANQ